MPPKRMIAEAERSGKYDNETWAGFDDVDEKDHTVTLTEDGIDKCEKLLGIANLYDDLQHASGRTTSTPALQAPTTSTSATRLRRARTARSSSSTSSPAA